MSNKKNDATNLTDLEEAFCYEYIKDLNATRAAIRAGYHKKDAFRGGAGVIRYRPRVSVFIDQLLEERRIACKIDANRVLEEVAAIAFVDINTFIKVENNKITQRDWSQSDTRCIQAVKSCDGSIEMKMHDKMKALELLSRHLKIVGGEITNDIAAAFVGSFNELIKKDSKKQIVRR